MISTGVEGPPALRGSPRKSRMARTLPLASPATMASPTRMVPRLMRMVATTPRPGSTLDSMTNPLAGASGLALRSATSATRRSMSRKFVEADALLGAGLDEDVVSAPLLGHDAVLGELLLELDVGVRLVDLVDATTMGTPAALAWSMASTVCGMTPSSAATTMRGDVGDLGAAGAHGRERGVARRVDEGDELAVVS